MKMSVPKLNTCWTPLIFKNKPGEEDSLLGILVMEVTVSIFAH